MHGFCHLLMGRAPVITGAKAWDVSVASVRCASLPTERVSLESGSNILERNKKEQSIFLGGQTFKTPVVGVIKGWQ